MFCPQCSTQLPDQSKFCFHCGTSLDFLSPPPNTGSANFEPPPSSLEEDFFDSSERFQILKTIGKGKMGVVYQARDQVLGRVVALKRFYMENKSTRLAIFRFLKKALQIAELNHSNIIPLYDVGEDNEGPFVSMKLVEGDNLFALARDRNRLDEKEVLLLGQQVGLAIDFAHNQGIVHGALKPSNILMEPRGILKVGDFGLAQVMAKNATRRRHRADNNFFYTAPEQFLDTMTLQPQSDIFAFGKLLYYLTVGREIEVESALIPSALKRLILKATERKPQNRYGQMSLMLEEIEFALKDRCSVSSASSALLSPPGVHPSSSDHQLTPPHSHSPDKQTSSCGHPNTTTSIFCGKCGKDLKIRCPLCNHEYSEFEDQCPNCHKAEVAPPPSKLSKSDWAELLKPQHGLPVEERDPASPNPDLMQNPLQNPQQDPLQDPLQDTMKDLDDFNFTQALAKIKTALQHNRESIDDFAQPPTSAPKAPSLEDSIQALLPNSSLSPPASPKADPMAQEYSNMAGAYLETCHYDKAISYSKKALHIDPNLRSSQEILKKASELEKQLNLSMKKAGDAEQKGQIKLAYQEWSRVLQLLPYHEAVRKKVDELKGKVDKLDGEAKKAVAAMGTQDSYEDYVKQQASKLGPNKRGSAVNQSSQASSVKEKLVKKDLEKAQDFLENGKFKDAKLYAKKVLQFDWSNKEAQEIVKVAQEMLYILAKLLDRADGYEGKKDYKKALLEWKKIREITPKNKKVQGKITEIEEKIQKSLEEELSKAEAFLENKEYRKVLLECQKILKIHPQNKYCQHLIDQSKDALKKAEAHLAQARDCFQKQNWQGVMDWAKKALAIDWKKQEAQDLMKKAVRFLETEEETSAKEEKMRLWLRKAQSLLEQEDYDLAISAAQVVLNSNPSEGKALQILQQSVQKKKIKDNRQTQLEAEAKEAAERQAQLQEQKLQEERAKEAAERQAQLQEQKLQEERAKEAAERQAQLQEQKLQEEQMARAETKREEDFEQEKMDLEGFLNSALSDRNEREEDNRRANEIRAILGMANDLVAQDQVDMAIQELERGLQRHPDSQEFQKRLDQLQHQLKENQKKRLAQKLAREKKSSEKEAPPQGPKPMEKYPEKQSPLSSIEVPKPTEKYPEKQSGPSRRMIKKHVTDRKKLAAMFQELLSDEEHEAYAKIKTPPLGEELSQELLKEIREMKNTELSKMETDMISRKEIEDAQQEALERSNLAQMKTEVLRETEKIRRATMDTAEIKKKELIEALEETEKEKNREEHIAGMETLSLDASEIEKLKAPPDYPPK